MINIPTDCDLRELSDYQANDAEIKKYEESKNTSLEIRDLHFGRCFMRRGSTLRAGCAAQAYIYIYIYGACMFSCIAG